MPGHLGLVSALTRVNVLSRAAPVWVAGFSITAIYGLVVERPTSSIFRPSTSDSKRQRVSATQRVSDGPPLLARFFVYDGDDWFFWRNPDVATRDCLLRGSFGDAGSQYVMGPIASSRLHSYQPNGPAENCLVV